MKTACFRFFFFSIISLSCAADAAEEPCVLWDPSAPVPAAAELPLLEGVRFESIKRREPEKDGYDWLHGVALVFHKGTLFSCWGHNKGLENTPTEVTQGRRSGDGGRTWSPVEMIADHTPTEGRSHGAYLSHKGVLWLFVGRFGNDSQGRKYARLKTEAFVFDEGSDTWKSRGLAADCFWPYEEPVRMKDGNWICGGMIVRPEIRHQAFPGVAISRGDDFTRWDTIEIPKPEEMRIWGETSVIVEEDEILAVVRGGAGLCNALVSVSTNCGRSWTELSRSNLPMTTSKPYAGKLSTGQRYLVCTNTRDCGHRRYPLTIAVGRPGEKRLCRMWKIRDGIRPEAGEVKNSALAYPYLVEHNGYAYVGYSTSILGGNRNNAELAVFPVKAVAVE